MPVNIDADGRRWVQAEISVPGSPEEVWNAIASGPGISAWFVPTQLDGRRGGSVTSDFGPGMLSQSTITEWEPPRRFVATSRDDMGPDDPTIATEWSVEAQAGGTCRVRVVHSWFTSSDAWDLQFEGATFGWLSFFRVLNGYLTHFRGQTATPFQLAATSPKPADEVWRTLGEPLGLLSAAPGSQIQPTSADAPPLSAVVEHINGAPWYEALLRLESPAPGLAHFVPHAMGDQITLTLRFYLFGPAARDAAVPAERAWRTWLAQRFTVLEPEASPA